MGKPAILLFDQDLPADCQVSLAEDAGLLLSADIADKVKLSSLLRFARQYVETYRECGWVTCVDDVMRLIVDDASVRGEAMLYLTGRRSFLVLRKRRTVMHATLGQVAETWLVRWDGVCGRMLEKDGDRWVEWSGKAER